MPGRKDIISFLLDIERAAQNQFFGPNRGGQRLARAANEARKELLQQQRLQSAAADTLSPTMDNGSFPLLEYFVDSVLVKAGHSDDDNALHMSLKLSLLEIGSPWKRKLQEHG